MGGGSRSEDAIFGVVRRPSAPFAFADERVMLVTKGGAVEGQV